MRDVVSVCVLISIVASSAAHAAGCTTIDARTSNLVVTKIKDYAKDLGLVDFIRLEGDFEIQLRADEINGISFGGLDNIEVTYADRKKVELGLKDSADSWTDSPTLSGRFRITDMKWDRQRQAHRPFFMPQSFKPFFCPLRSPQFFGVNVSQLAYDSYFGGYDKCLFHGFWSLEADGSPTMLEGRGWIDFARIGHSQHMTPKPNYSGMLTFNGEFRQTYRADYLDWDNTYTLNLPLEYTCWTGHHEDNCWGNSNQGCQD